MNTQKFKQPLLLAIAMVVTDASSQAASLTGPVYNPANGHNYYLLSPSTWSAAESEALGLGGHLVTVNDSAENAWLQSTFSVYGGIRRDLWIGLNDFASNGNYVWASGETPAYTNWTWDNPNDFGNQSVVFLYSGPSPGNLPHIAGWAAGQWDTYDDSATYYHNGEGTRFIAGVVEVPEPSAMAITLLAAFSYVTRNRCRK